MKNNRLYALLYLLFGVAGMVIFLPRNENGEAFEEELEQSIPLRDRMDLAWQQEFEMTKDPKTGDVPRERLLEAWQYMKSRQTYGKAAIAGVQWQERGPNNQGGRTRAILVDMNDPTYNTVWVGSAGGGLWKTTDITATSPAWTPINEFFQNLAITYITQDPVNPNKMYFCTGEGNGNSDAIRGLGVWKSIDGGATWSQLSATNNSNYYYCNKVLAIGSDTLFVCSTTGLYRSVNGGTSFTKVLGSGISSAGGNVSYDIERMNNGTLYASTSSGSSGSGTIHKSYNNGTTWTTPLTINSLGNEHEIELAVADNDTATVWGLVENNNRIAYIIKSVNGGISFDSTSGHPYDADPGIPGSGNPAKDFSRGQAWYDLSIAVDPNNSAVCFVGGVDLFKTSTGGVLWTQVAHWTGSYGYPEVHADQHIAVFSPGSSSIIYFGNDGGIYRSANATSSAPTMVNKGNNYNTAQFYACAIHPTAGTVHFLAGAQDNGSHRFTSSGINSTVEITGGDGAFCHIDQTQPSYQFTSYTYNNYFRSTNGGSSFSSVSISNSGRFINPTDYDDSLGVLYCAYTTDYYLAWTNARTGTTAISRNISLFGGSQVSAVKKSRVANRVYFGTGGGRIVRVDNATATTPTATHINSTATTMPTTYVSCVEVDPNDDNHIFAVYSSFGVNSVWETKNGGTSWTSIEGNLPDMPIRWIAINPSKPWQALVATELGVWSTDSIRGTSTNWAASNSGLANVRVDMLQCRASDKLVIAATHGRGLYSSDVFMDPTADFTADRPVTYQCKPVQFNSTSSKATTWLWNFGDGSTSTQANPKKMYGNAGRYTVTLTINGGAATKTMTNYITVLPYRATPYFGADGGNFEVNPYDFASNAPSGTAFERGSSGTSGKSGVLSGSNAWVTGLTGSYANNTVSYLYTPNFNFETFGTYLLRFYAKNLFELSYDGYIVQYSLDTGNTWTTLSTSVATGWYDYANTTLTTAFPPGQAFFNATNAAYSLKSYNVSMLGGNTQVCFRFVFQSDASTTAAGLAIEDFEISGPPNVVLPVSLLSFTGTRTGKNVVELGWKTATEKGNRGFNLQRKMDWDDEFTNVAFIKGHESSNTLQAYSFADANSNDRESYYRLQQMDNDGTYVYSNIVAVHGNNPHHEKLVDSIVPFADKSFRLLVKPDAPVVLHVVNNIGQVMRTMQLDRNNNQVELHDLAPGIYYFQLQLNGQTQVEKVFVN